MKKKKLKTLEVINFSLTAQHQSQGGGWRCNSYLAY